MIREANTQHSTPLVTSIAACHFDGAATWVWGVRDVPTHPFALSGGGQGIFYPTQACRYGAKCTHERYNIANLELMDPRVVNICGYLVQWYTWYFAAVILVLITGYGVTNLIDSACGT